MKTEKNPATEASSIPAAERPFPTLSPDSKGSDKAKIILALSQPGKPLYNFWLAPTQEALQLATAEIAHGLTQKGKTPREIASVLSIIGSANASALKQFVEKNLSLPSGQNAVATGQDAATLIASLGL